jgi:hypothetical protein
MKQILTAFWLTALLTVTSLASGFNGLPLPARAGAPGHEGHGMSVFQFQNQGFESSARHLKGMPIPDRYRYRPAQRSLVERTGVFALVEAVCRR